MASRKRNYRNKQGMNRYDDGFNQQSYYNNHRPSQQSGHRENQYYCDICGYTIPQAGNVPPVCTRCLISMTLLRANSQTRAKIDKKQAYDYSSKFYFKTDGHPQYKGLPIDHPDPDDAEAMEAYKQRKQGRRRRTGKPAGSESGSHDKHSKPYEKRSKSFRPTAEKKQAQELEKITVQETSSKIDSEKQTSTKESSPPKRKNIPSPKQPRKSPVQKEEKRIKEPLTKELREEDYEGTALTSNRSPATILSDTLNENQLNDIRGDLRSDYTFNQPTPSPDFDQVKAPEQDENS